MEYASGGELFNKITTGGKIAENEAKNLFAQVISAVQFMVSCLNKMLSQCFIIIPKLYGMGYLKLYSSIILHPLPITRGPTTHMLEAIRSNVDVVVTSNTLLSLSSALADQVWFLSILSVHEVRECLLSFGTEFFFVF
jgi:hypothetical protein